ncbi:hypothetical protein H2279_06815 [Campylobacter sp. B0100352/1]|nr:hypothetical protein [Campylobacter sp. B0100352/1]
MKDFKELEIIPNFSYEVDPLTAEELGAFEENALNEKDAKEGIEDQG